MKNYLKITILTILLAASCGSPSDSDKDNKNNQQGEQDNGSQKPDSTSSKKKSDSDKTEDKPKPEETTKPDTDQPEVELWPGEAELTKLDLCDGKPCNESIEGFILASIDMGLETFYAYNSTLSEKDGEFSFSVVDHKKIFTFESYKGEKYTIASGEWAARSGYLALRNSENTEAYYFSLTQLGDVSGFTGKVNVVFSDGSINPRTIRLK